MSAPGQTLRLEKTVFHRGRLVREVTMRAPTQADMDEACAVCESDGERGLYLVAKLCNVRPGVIRKMTEDDMGRLGAIYDRLAPQ